MQVVGRGINLKFMKETWSIAYAMGCDKLCTFVTTSPNNSTDATAEHILEAIKTRADWWYYAISLEYRLMGFKWTSLFPVLDFIPTLSHKDYPNDVQCHFGNQSKTFLPSVLVHSSQPSTQFHEIENLFNLTLWQLAEKNFTMKINVIQMR